MRLSQMKQTRKSQTRIDLIHHGMGKARRQSLVTVRTQSGEPLQIKDIKIAQLPMPEGRRHFLAEIQHRDPRLPGPGRLPRPGRGWPPPDSLEHVPRQASVRSASLLEQRGFEPTVCFRVLGPVSEITRDFAPELSQNGDRSFGLRNPETEPLGPHMSTEKSKEHRRFESACSDPATSHCKPPAPFSHSRNSLAQNWWHLWQVRNREAERTFHGP